MTRWTFYLILNDKLLSSLEFNWDMYPPTEWWGWYWNEALKVLKNVKTEKDFEKMVDKFNKEHHNYQNEDLIYNHTLKTLIKYKDFSKDYFDFWFSDWIFIKNLSDKDYNFILRDWEWVFTLKKWETIRFNFWRIGQEDIKKYYPKMKLDIPQNFFNNLIA